MLIDSHCHLDFPELAERLDECLINMAGHGVGRALCVAVNLEDFPRVRSLAARDARLRASVGVHPEYRDVREPDVSTLLSLAADPLVVAIGETGLDYYRHPADTLDWQRERFRVHIRAARQCGKPLIVHTRSSAADTVRILAEEGAEAVGGVMHCFTEDWATAQAAIELGFCISFSGIVTFRNAAALRAVALQVPDEALLIETDSPYLAPVPHRGRTNEPAYVRHVAQCLADLRGVSLEHIAQVTTANFERLFGR
ncbi:MAG: putative deoxyribonuclease YcfH [Pseudomonadota bacterium]|jgi:TatD DNase family protein